MPGDALVQIVIAGLVPAIPLGMALCPMNRDGRDKPGHDKVKASRGRESEMPFRLFAAVFFLLLALPAQAASCGGDFHAFLGQIARDAQAAGISRGVIDQAFAGLTPDPAVLAFDRRQRGIFPPRASSNTPPPGSSRPASAAPRG